MDSRVQQEWVSETRFTIVVCGLGFTPPYYIIIGHRCRERCVKTDSRDQQLEGCVERDSHCGLWTGFHAWTLVSTVNIDSLLLESVKADSLVQQWGCVKCDSHCGFVTLVNWVSRRHISKYREYKFSHPYCSSASGTFGDTFCISLLTLARSRFFYWDNWITDLDDFFFWKGGT